MPAFLICSGLSASPDGLHFYRVTWGSLTVLILGKTTRLLWLRVVLVVKSDIQNILDALMQSVLVHVKAASRLHSLFFIFKLVSSLMYYILITVSAPFTPLSPSPHLLSPSDSSSASLKEIKNSRFPRDSHQIWPKKMQYDWAQSLISWLDVVTQ